MVFLFWLTSLSVITSSCICCFLHDGYLLSSYYVPDFTTHNNSVGLVLSLFPLNRQDTKRLIKLPEATSRAKIWPQVFLYLYCYPLPVAVSSTTVWNVWILWDSSAAAGLRCSVRTQIKVIRAWSPHLGDPFQLAFHLLPFSVACSLPWFPEIGFDGGRSGWLRSIFLPNLRTNWERLTYQRDGDQDAGLATPPRALPNRGGTYSWAGFKRTQRGLMDTSCSFLKVRQRSFAPSVQLMILSLYGNLLSFMNHFAVHSLIQSYLNSLRVEE